MGSSIFGKDDDGRKREPVHPFLRKTDSGNGCWYLTEVSVDGDPEIAFVEGFGPIAG